MCTVSVTRVAVHVKGAPINPCCGARNPQASLMPHTRPHQPCCGARNPTKLSLMPPAHPQAPEMTLLRCGLLAAAADVHTY